MLKKLGIKPAPVSFGRYQKLGIEGFFAGSMWAINALFTNIVTFGSLPIYAQEDMQAENPLSWKQSFAIGFFNFLFIYSFIVYLNVSLCDPGRLESDKEKQFIKDRFTRLQQELEEQKTEASLIED